MENTPAQLSFLDKAINAVKNMSEEEFLASIQAVEQLKENPKAFGDFSQEELRQKFTLTKEKILKAIESKQQPTPQ